MTAPLTSDKLARLAGCSVSYVQRARRRGAIVGTPSGLAGNNTPSWTFDQSAVETLRAMKAEARVRQGRSQHVRPVHRRWCEMEQRHCVMHDLAPDSCACCRRRREEPNGIVSGWHAEQASVGGVR